MKALVTEAELPIDANRKLCYSRKKQSCFARCVVVLRCKDCLRSSSLFSLRAAVAVAGSSQPRTVDCVARPKVVTIVTTLTAAAAAASVGPILEIGSSQQSASQ